MSLRDAYPRPRTVTLQYFFSSVRGDDLRTYALRPALLWTFGAVFVALAIWSVGSTLFILFHDDMLATLIARQAEMQYSYEDRLADARAEIDRVTSRQLLDQTSFEGKVHELLSRQAQLEQRTSIVASMAKEAGARPAIAAAVDRTHIKIGAANAKPASALSAVEAVGAPSDSDGAPDSASAFAPVAPSTTGSIAPAKPRPLDEPRAAPDPHQHTSALAPSDSEQRALADLNAAADDPAIAAPTRLNLIAYSLDRMERRQTSALTEIGATANATVTRLRQVFDDAGVAPDKVAPPVAKGGVGGPFIPIKADSNAPVFDKQVASVENLLVVEDQLRRALPFTPLRRPLFGEAEISSPFGYRPDPFLGRPALHPGVDLVQEYGADVKSTGAGRVTHAGPMGGYGNLVEIDHGGGLVTRYGHLSEVLVEEGQEVKANEIVGRLGSTGRSTGPHLHYEVRVDGEPVDPMRFLKAGGLLLASE
ncbi:MAG TPA: M23 family metallopeptidase [Roseiarcus sp.]|nr:M23 family metallopeptidase [Roseiarcus sp.]